MTKVYIVRFGEYSDQWIAGVFSTEEKARKYCDVYNEVDTYENYWIDDRTLDEDEVSPEAKVVTYYSVCIAIESDDYMEAGEIYCKEEEKDIYTKPVVINHMKNSDYIEVRFTESMEKATKIAIEQYQIYTQQKLENGEL